MNKNDIIDSYQKHAALAQFHRWYLVYEKPEYGINNALDILADDITVKSGLGEAHGHEEYASRVKQISPTWKNSHHICSVKFEDNTHLKAEIRYLNQGMLPDGKVRSADLTYHIELKAGLGILPKLSCVEIVQNSETCVDQFEDMYVQNRVLSLVHYWLALAENPARDSQPAKEILAEGFRLNFSSGAITTFDKFDRWLTGPAAQLSHAAHVASDIQIQPMGSGNYAFSAVMDWEGIRPDGLEMIAKTQHNWTIIDEPSDRFARIQSIDVEILNPFTMKN